jgi:hypothetical protein
MLQNSGSVTTRINPPLSPAEREQRYRQALRELRDPRPTLQIGITEDMVRDLLKRGYLGPDECDVPRPAPYKVRTSPFFGSAGCDCSIFSCWRDPTQAWFGRENSPSGLPYCSLHSPFMNSCEI